MRHILSTLYFWLLALFILVIMLILSWLAWRAPGILRIHPGSDAQTVCQIMIIFVGSLILLLMAIYRAAIRRAGGLAYEEQRQLLNGDDREDPPISATPLHTAPAFEGLDVATDVIMTHLPM